MAVHDLQTETVAKAPLKDEAEQRASVSAARSARARQRRLLLITLLVSDAAMVAGALLLAWYVRIGSGLLPYYAPTNPRDYILATSLASIVMLGLFAQQGLYDFDLLLGGPDEYAAVFRACTYGIVALVLFSFWQRSQPLSRGWLLLAWFLSFVSVGGTRFLWRRLFQWLRRTQGWFLSPTLVVGSDEHARAIARQLHGHESGLWIVGFLDDFLPAGTRVTEDLTVVGPPRFLADLAEDHGVERVILVPNAVAWETFQDIVRSAGQTNGYEVMLSPGFYETLTTGVQVIQKAHVPLLRISGVRISGLDRQLKRALDCVVGSVLALVTLPLSIAIAVALRVTEGSPVLARPEVLGLHGVPFRGFKFRTGLEGSSRRFLGGENHIDIEAPRSFALGRFLYHTGLDKLPQLVDVLLGRMSLVGPRTVSVASGAETETWLPSLLTVKPGWTGPWAVAGSRSQDAEMRLALHYIRNWTIWLDLQILYQTARSVLFRGARPPRRSD